MASVTAGAKHSRQSTEPSLPGSTSRKAYRLMTLRQCSWACHALCNLTCLAFEKNAGEVIPACARGRTGRTCRTGRRTCGATSRGRPRSSSIPSTTASRGAASPANPAGLCGWRANSTLVFRNSSDTRREVTEHSSKCPRDSSYFSEKKLFKNMRGGSSRREAMIAANGGNIKY